MREDVDWIDELMKKKTNAAVRVSVNEQEEYEDP